MVSLLSFIIVLGIIIFVHELGHFIAAKLVGIRVEVFSLGFPPKIVGKKIGETEYQISWIPLGGFVKMAGMIDESLDNKPLTGAAWEFMSKNTLQKIFVITAGVIMNFLLGFIIYTFITLFSGIGEIGPAKVGGVEKGMPAEAAGILPGDLIVEVNSQHIEDWEGMAGVIHALPDSNIDVVWMRGDTTLSAVIHTESREWVREGEIVQLGQIGIRPQLQTRPANIIESVSNGAVTTVFIAGNAYFGVKMLVTGKAGIKDFIGPVGLVHFSGETVRTGLANFAGFIALISIYIAFFNILPLPVLDGGHVVYILIEAVIRKPIPSKVKMIIQQVGMALLLVFMLIIAYNDLMRYFIK